MEIIIGRGLGDIVFGMYEDDIVSMLGEADKINYSEKENGVVYYYNDKMIKLKFDKDEDGKLYSIEVFHPDLILFDQKVIDKKKEEIENLLMKNECYNLEFEDYDTFETLFCEKIWSTFMFEFNKLRSIEFSPLFKNENDIIWP